MALPTSPPITLQQIAAEFNNIGIVTLSNLYRGGTWVPNIPQNSGVPTSGAISLLDFLGATAQPPLAGTLAGLLGSFTDPLLIRPPNQRFINAYPTANPTGGSGTYTYSWSITSGAASITAGATSRACTIGANVTNHSSVSGNIRCVISDGSSSVTVNGGYTLMYSGGQPV